jgi:phosphate starvation-inducible protein PhoH and related proteins
VKDSGLDIEIQLDSIDEARTLLGPLDSNARLVRDAFGVSVLLRDGSLRLLGPAYQVDVVRRVFEDCVKRLRKGKMLTTAHIAEQLRSAGERAGESVALPPTDGGPRGEGGGQTVKPRSPGQKRYLVAMSDFDVVFSIGPAGTGKTYLAVAAAVEAVKRGEARRIVLVRPAVEAGEKLGFLPGDYQAKVDPYMRPLYDALYDLLEFEKVERFFERSQIEVAPIAFMRGRTLSEAFVIIDEAQNTTPEQMKMVLTRVGLGSKVVVTGDITQIDLPPGKISGLVEAISVLSGVEGISFCYFDDKDVVRHRLVQSIIKAYEAWSGEKPPGR